MVNRRGQRGSRRANTRSTPRNILMIQPVNSLIRTYEFVIADSDGKGSHVITVSPPGDLVPTIRLRTVKFSAITSGAASIQVLISADSQVLIQTAWISVAQSAKTITLKVPKTYASHQNYKIAFNTRHGNVIVNGIYTLSYFAVEEDD